MAADGLSLLERLEGKLEEHPGMTLAIIRGGVDCERRWMRAVGESL